MQVGSLGSPRCPTQIKSYRKAKVIRPFIKATLAVTGIFKKQGGGQWPRIKQLLKLLRTQDALQAGVQGMPSELPAKPAGTPRAPWGSLDPPSCRGVGRERPSVSGLTGPPPMWRNRIVNPWAWAPGAANSV